MKRTLLLTLFAGIGLIAIGQSSKNKPGKNNTEYNSLLWRISGKDLTRPSYLFGTMHMVCASDITISDSLKNAIRSADKVYLEIDMDNMAEMFMKMLMNPGAMTMRGDTTLSDLLTPGEYKKVKQFFEQSGNKLLPFAVMEKMKPLLLQSMMIDRSGVCENMIIMEQLVMDEAGKSNKEIDGLETIDYQLGIFDKIPYKLQAQGLVKMAEDTTDGSGMEELTKTYRSQQLGKLEELTMQDESISQFADILLYNRNTAWANKLENLMKDKSLVIAVGAGHLPGDKGVISLLRKAGYKVEPVRNDMIKKPVKEI